ncbi:uncharacterized protein AMSG_10218 [Thecamonas trahens ATCC 50062]|uniref:Uncharacterized protein n=1 Tax=Thecamonas trahens ATCC 50062 TaxID=461836 RepID=A0A0L0DU17_THETB|nr:hypothetical protein AMSG_10218 [Thecamonas trahens ATCC 50062]KNC54973.1 hypothetical protein AMSG_10218 [Thecamonas trahens ATCC 50062]|eukprot:XP_013753420.1 hypothetical protein AMSG_10218 [Thecamonas trahens ATCC 50062]
MFVVVPHAPSSLWGSVAVFCRGHELHVWPLDGLALPPWARAMTGDDVAEPSALDALLDDVDAPLTGLYAVRPPRSEHNLIAWIAAELAAWSDDCRAAVSTAAAAARSGGRITDRTRRRKEKKSKTRRKGRRRWLRPWSRRPLLESSSSGELAQAPSDSCGIDLTDGGFAAFRRRLNMVHWSEMHHNALDFPRGLEVVVEPRLAAGTSMASLAISPSATSLTAGSYYDLPMASPADMARAHSVLGLEHISPIKLAPNPADTSSSAAASSEADEPESDAEIEEPAAGVSWRSTSGSRMIDLISL